MSGGSQCMQQNELAYWPRRFANFCDRCRAFLMICISLSQAQKKYGPGVVQRLAGPRNHVLGPRRIGILLHAAHGRVLVCRRQHVDLEARRGNGFTHPLLTAFFVAEGDAFQIGASLSYRYVMPNSWGWLLASGIADLVLAGACHFLLAGECELDARPHRGCQLDRGRTGNCYDSDESSQCRKISGAICCIG